MTAPRRFGARLAAAFGLVSMSILVAGHAPMVCGDETAAPAELRVLFVGNSLTYWNDLPAMVGRIAKENKRRFKSKTIAFPDFALFDHAEKGDAAKEIAKGNWSLVVMQQGPSGAPENREILIDHTKRFAVDIRKAGGRPALYQVWPSASRAGDMDRVCESYRLAAEAVDGLLLPVGEAWKDVLGSDPKVALYSEDGFHPTVAGSLLAALVIYERVFGEPPANLPRFDVPEAQVAVLRAAASRVCLRTSPATGAVTPATEPGSDAARSDDPPPSLRVSEARLRQTATSSVNPVTPADLNVEGEVVVEIVVDASGRVERVRAVSGHPMLRGAAIDAARQWTFTPAVRKNVPVRVIGTLTFTFKARQDR